MDSRTEAIVTEYGSAKINRRVFFERLIPLMGSYPLAHRLLETNGLATSLIPQQRGNPTVKTIPKAYKTITQRNVPAKMRDGITLYADIYRPDAPGRFPVILIRTPYDKSGLPHYRPPYEKRTSDRIPEYAQRFVPLGYVVIYQDCRARFASEGEWYYPLIHEAADGYDSIGWAASLPWSDGNVGMAGQSHMAAVQYLVAPTRPPHLRALFPISAPSDWHESWVYHTGGALEWIWLIPYTLSLVPNQIERKGIAASRWEMLRSYFVDPEVIIGPIRDEHYRHLPLAEWGEILNDVAPYFRDYFDHPEDGPYWWQLSLRRRFHEVNVPIYHVTSWYDGFLEGGLYNFMGIREQGMTTEARAAQKLLVGPWSHIPSYDTPTTGGAGDIDFGPEAGIQILDITQRWFDYWLKGVDSGITREAPVQIFVMGENVWREEQEWPLARTQYTPFYFHSRGAANTLNGDGILSPVLPQAEKIDSYVYDPNDPVPTQGGNFLRRSPGAYDQRDVEARQDVLVYTSEPLTQDLEATGPLVVKLYAASTAPDTDFTVKLVDVRPDGYAQNLQDGIIRARYRLSKTNPSLITPGEVYNYTIDLWATSHVFKTGHRIRVEVSSSNFPHFDRNPNTGGPLFKEKEFRKATQTVLHDAAHPSHIILPVIPR